MSFYLCLFFLHVAAPGAPLESISVAPPAEPRGEKKTFFCANFGL